ncbi:putative AlkP superfamily pyrophosphatase or phosphodiesterase [Chitinophaga dinghuensis]|uniref:Putative AlkP superfamily pyrophosphatase or phosphodiesterase n=1 Tax=Chitinophaga dinghuensis TaxID=1539050 RepID=A0A327WJ25_9BACT|nr:ectonucleotide pyrophosphatase/phosphodiesterase [Chitinophaga dinghuensis]RAJ87774.1 putative AlkP superfamily pyrophosphatase or phosphodiesterase [Chitinophaga dinghuensis]
MKRLFIVVAAVLFVGLQVQAQDTTQQIVEGRANSASNQTRPYVIMISIDGFRFDYAEKYGAENLQRLSENGVRALAMQPSFPSLTFPNHYSIVTGLYPAHHGLVDNHFWDRKRKEAYKVGNVAAVTDGSWYGGVPLWVLAEKNKMVTASYFWVGSESAIQGIRPTYYFQYQEKTGIDSRIKQVTDWLKLPEEKRPHLITFYFPEVDHAGHRYGPDSDSVRAAVKFVDAAIAKMTAEVNKLNLPVSFVIVSDHGMLKVDNDHAIPMPEDTVLTTLKVLAGGEKTMYYGEKPEDIQKAYEYLKQHENHYTAYLKQETPVRWHYGQEDIYNRIGDIILVAEPGYAFQSGSRKPPLGHHGYDNNLTDMNAIFMAWGPAFKSHQRLATFENVNVYPMVARILGLTITQPIDGKLEVLESILK